jgi:hypothetical protein
MKYNEFVDFLSIDNPPEQINGNLKSLWYDANGSWEKAHKIVQEINNHDAALIHVYLHRKEGDIGNARYWYSRAGENEFSGSLDEEWEYILKFMLLKKLNKR